MRETWWMTGVMIMGLLWFGTKLISAEPRPRLPTVDRSPLARVTGSSSRVSTVEEISGARGVVALVTLYTPQIRARWIPAYAVDKSPLTMWASEGAANESLSCDFGNRLQSQVSIQYIVIDWGADFARQYRIEASPDNQAWRTIHEQSAGQGGQEVIDLGKSVPARAVRLFCQTPSSKNGFAVIQFGVYGPKDERKLPGIKELHAAGRGNDQVTVSWTAEGTEGVWVYRVHRSTSADFIPGPENLIAAVDTNSHLDRGLDPGTTYYYKVVPESFSGATGPADKTEKATTAADPLTPRMPMRGVVEGFYNDPWPHQERLKMIEFMEDCHLNYYIYAPKVEPYHRQWWRRTYPDDELLNFKELIAASHAHRVTFNYGISPGLDFDYRKPEEIEVLKNKLKSMFDIGVRAFTVCLDDIPDYTRADGKVAADQAAMVNQVHAWLKSLDPKTTLFFVPTVYMYSYSYWEKKKPAYAEYLREISRIDQEVTIFWTGPGGVFTENYDLASAAELKQVLGRPVALWDNYPVNDVSLRFNVFLGPYRGRDPRLGQALSGIFNNPMYLPEANMIPLYTVGRYQMDPDYDPWKAYEEALHFVGGEKGYAPLKALADTLVNQPLFESWGANTTPLAGAIEDFWKARESGNAEPEEAKLRALFEAYRDNPEQLQKNLDMEHHHLVVELLPASRKLSLYGQMGLKCLDYLETADPGKKAELSQEILALQAQSQQNPWHVADDRTSAMSLIQGKFKRKGVVMESFVARCLRK